jgi:hypothetical protein
MTAWYTSTCGLRESDANVLVCNDARGGDGASDLRARGAWCPGDERHAAESELTEWMEPRSDAADSVDAADDADAERGTRLECGVPCGSGVDAPAGNASGVGILGLEDDEDQRLRRRGSGADGRSSTSRRPATGMQPQSPDTYIWVKTVFVQSMELAGMRSASNIGRAAIWDHNRGRRR